MVLLLIVIALCMYVVVCKDTQMNEEGNSNIISKIPSPVRRCHAQVIGAGRGTCHTSHLEALH